MIHAERSLHDWKQKNGLKIADDGEATVTERVPVVKIIVIVL